MDELISFGPWLKRRRKTLDLMQDELARLASVSLGTIRKWEADERRPSKEVATRLAEVLAVPADDRAAFLKVAGAELAADQLASAAGAPVVDNPPAVPRPRRQNLPVPLTPSR